jgi:hypothetical protein
MQLSYLLQIRFVIMQLQRAATFYTYPSTGYLLGRATYTCLPRRPRALLLWPLPYYVHMKLLHPRHVREKAIHYSTHSVVQPCCVAPCDAAFAP